MHVLRERREDLLQAGLCQVRPARARAQLLPAEGWGCPRRLIRAPRLGEKATPAPHVGRRAHLGPRTPRGRVPASSLWATKRPGRAGPEPVAAPEARQASGSSLTPTAPWARRLFGIKCAKCQVGFSSSDLVMRARDSVYHIECFRCSVCSRQLLPGDEFSLREHELLCRADHGLLLERAAAGSPRSPGPLPGARGLHLPGKPRAGPNAVVSACLCVRGACAPMKSCHSGVVPFARIFECRTVARNTAKCVFGWGSHGGVGHNTTNRDCVCIWGIVENCVLHDPEYRTKVNNHRI